MKVHAGYVWLLIVCTSISLGWIAVCVLYNWQTHAGRGGSIGVSLAFFILFLQRRHRYNSIDVLDDFTKEISGSIQDNDEKKKQTDKNKRSIAMNERRINAIKRDMRRSRLKAELENVYLAAASVISTLCWGWGDYIVYLAN